MTEWRVFADDRTGAFEVAGLVADSSGAPVPVRVGAAHVPVGEPFAVVDLDTRALDADGAVAAVRAVAEHPGLALHKIDSTLRGNWAVEVRARRLAARRRVVLLPAWPQMGRTCERGVVQVFGQPAGTIRDHVPEARLLPHAAALGAWWRAGGDVASCDLPDEERVAAMARAVAALPAEQLLVAGPAGPLAAVIGARSPQRVVPRPVARRSGLVADGPVVVVCGSANDVSHRQVERLRSRLAADAAHAASQVALVVAERTDGDLHRDVARRLADDAHRRIAAIDARAVVVLGGDTAAALLGDAPRSVGGMFAPGMPWSRSIDGSGPLVVTKAGGFGGIDALVSVVLGETV